MSAVANLCQCCREEAAEMRYDPDLGTVCVECHEGAVAGKAAMWRKKIAGVFTGRCGDNEPTRREAP